MLDLSEAWNDPPARPRKRPAIARLAPAGLSRTGKIHPAAHGTPEAILGGFFDRPLLPTPPPVRAGGGRFRGGPAAGAPDHRSRVRRVRWHAEGNEAGAQRRPRSRSTESANVVRAPAPPAPSVKLVVNERPAPSRRRAGRG